jgi:ring-1,2-phenylacetyl-CoA epoxidase subunit PaaD
VVNGGRPALDPAALARALGDGWESESLGGASAPAAAVTREPLTRDAVWAALETVPDPEVPVISVVELGIVRAVEIDGDVPTIVITPTYSGCPAMREIERDVRAALAARGWTDARIRTEYAPAWTTDWMSDAAREKLRAYGIAPPRAGGGGATELVPLLRRGVEAPVPCPFCGSHDTALRSAFGSTACKALHYCQACRQPFEEFKRI